MTDRDLPLDWPTPDQRARVDARARALRHRRLAWRSSAAGVAIALVVGLVVIVRGASSPSRVATADSVSTTITTTAPPAIVSAPEPAGWRIVDFGDARLAFPPGWQSPSSFLVPAHPPCATFAGGVVGFFRPSADCPKVTIAALGTTQLPPRPVMTVHGLSVYLAADGITFRTYAVPALHVSITLDGAAAQPILDTLTSSARRVVLGGGAAPPVPDGWKTLTFDGVSLEVPPTMPVTELDAHHLAPGECDAVPFPQSGAYLGDGVTGAVNCPAIFAVVPVPTDGVWIHTATSGGPAKFDGRIDNGHVRLAVADVAMYGAPGLDPALDVEIVGPRATVIRVGLGADPEIARTIIGSIRVSGR
jgi:hypothetical protein